MAHDSNLSGLMALFAQDLRRAETTWNSTSRLSFVNSAFAMIGDRLRSPANEGFLTLTAEAGQTNIYLLPEDYVEMRFVEQIHGNHADRLRPVSITQAHRFETLGSQPLGYLVYSGKESPSTPGSNNQSGQMVLQLIPGNGEDIEIDYWQQPTQVSGTGGTQTNPVLQAHFQLCLWGTEIFAWQSVQNWEQRDRVQQLFDAELARINTAANTARYGAGVAASAPGRFYNSAPSRAM